MTKTTACAILFLAAMHSIAQTSVVVGIHESGSISWSNNASNGTYAIEWASTPTGAWNRTWAGNVGIPASGDEMSTAVPMFYRVAFFPARTNGPLFEDFEDVGGWSNKAEGTWTHAANSGIWKSFGAAAASNSLNARSGNRYIWMNSFDEFELPPVDNPTQVVVWVRGPSPSSTYTLGLKYFDGNTWQSHGSIWGGGNVYTAMVWNLEIGLPNPGQSFRLEGSWDKYIDDIRVNVAP